MHVFKSAFESDSNYSLESGKNYSLSLTNQDKNHHHHGLKLACKIWCVLTVASCYIWIHRQTLYLKRAAAL